MLVALDSNVWIGQRLLRSSSGAALLYILRREGGRILFPAVIRDETVHKLTQAGLDARKRIEQDLATIQALVGSRPEVTLADEARIRAAIESRLGELSNFLMPLAPRPEHWERALARVIRGAPPNTTREQFRDSLILEQLMKPATDERVHFVTGDNDFYAAKMTTEIVSALAAELAERGAQIDFSRDLEALLLTLADRVTIDKAVISEALRLELVPLLTEKATSRGQRLGNLLDDAVDAFMTEDPSALAVSFSLTFDLSGVQLPDGSLTDDGHMIAIGNAMFDPTAARVSNLQMGRIETRLARTGELLYADAYIYAATATVAARAEAPFRVRREFER